MDEQNSGEQSNADVKGPEGVVTGASAPTDQVAAATTEQPRSKKQLVLTEIENIEMKLKVLFGGVHDELAEIIAKVRGHLE
jgi:hypothetical protein